MIKREIYECEHCHKKRYMSRYRMADHERMCWYNPKVKACNTCEHISYEGSTRTCTIGVKLYQDVFPSKPATDCILWQPISIDEEDRDDD